MIFKRKRVSFSIWNYDVDIVITDDFNKAAKRMKLREPQDGPAQDGSTGGITFHEVDNGYSALFIPPKADVKVIAHESWHCIRRMLVYCGAKLDNETVAYHLGFLSQTAYNFSRSKK